MIIYGRWELHTLFSGRTSNDGTSRLLERHSEAPFLLLSTRSFLLMPLNTTTPAVHIAIAADILAAVSSCDLFQCPIHVVCVNMLHHLKILTLTCSVCSNNEGWYIDAMHSICARFSPHAEPALSRLTPTCDSNLTCDSSISISLLYPAKKLH